MQENLRLLAAIMFTDLVGYTALMQQDETRAKAIRDKHRRVLEDKITSYRGRILQYYGDGTLSMFGSVIEAAKCSVEIQKELQKEPKIPLRIGIHLGDIVYEDEGIYGDGVNVASRIQSLAEAGSVFISDKVFDEIQNHPELRAKSYGSFDLKNVSRQVEIFALQSDNLFVPSEEIIRKKSGRNKRSVAVLPFVNMSSDPDNEFFSDGITEEIINALTKIEGLHVTSRTSSFSFKNRNDDIREIGKKLNVHSVLEGSVRKAGNKVRITAQLINTADGYHVFSENFDRSLEDIFQVQDEISQKIARMLRQNLSQKNHPKKLIKPQTRNMDAYKHYLKGLHLWNKWNPQDVEEAITVFEEVIKMDDQFVLPYVRLSGCYTFLGAIGYKKAEDCYPQARKYAEKSLELDDSLGAAYSAIAITKLFSDWDFGGATRDMEKAIELNPGSAEIRNYNTLLLSACGEREKMLGEAELALTLDPLSIPINHWLGAAYLENDKNVAAIDQFKRTLKMDPTFRNSINGLGWAYYFNDEFEQAIETFKRIPELLKDESKGAAPLGFVYGRMGFIDKAQECLELLESRARKEENVSLEPDFALVYAGMNKEDKFIEYLQKTFYNRLGGLIFLRTRIWDEYRDHPEFKRIVKEVNKGKK
ncbi:MAG: tetratricopeptide repeat protein [Melioribacteraceae bacterium]|nr:tetratricopeptide repeat protein [Melioribacteraceae bacterium]